MPTRQLLKKSVRWHKTIQFKIILSVALTTMAVNGFFTYVYLDVQAKTLDATILKSASLMSETIKASIQFDMVRNLKEEAYHIMKSIGSQQGIEKVRIYASDGRILFSTHEGEQETMVDKKAEACYGCHAEAAPLEHLTVPSRTRIFPSGKGYRVLGMINPLYNEPNCYTAACHAHPASQKVLGVIDVTMSLAYADAEIRSFRRQIILFNILSIVSISTIAVLALMFVVGNPIRQLVHGTERVAHGDLAHSIPIDSDDEMGFLARSFNHMTENLRKANDEIREWIRTLEQKVEDRTKELKDAQFQLMHAEKLASLGKIAATVAHEINNPLSGVYTYVKLMERKIEQGQGESPDVEKFREYLSTMSREVQRTSAIVQNLLDFTRPKELARKVVNLNSLVEESLEIVRNKLAIADIEVEKVMKPLPEIPADPSQMKQVFINLIINACEAMQSGGVLAIKSWHDKIRDKVMIAFADTGPGISPEARSHLFDPFFTTKEKGTGLGLAVVYQIITRHNGTIDVKSSPGEGTEMLITLPTG